MIKLSVFYPNQEGKRFDIVYYSKTHMALVQRLCGTALKGVAVEHGISGMASDSPPPFVAMGHLYFESVEAFRASFGPHTNEIVGDLPNFTDIQPSIQLSEVTL